LRGGYGLEFGDGLVFDNGCESRAGVRGGVGWGLVGERVGPEVGEEPTGGLDVPSRRNPHRRRRGRYLRQGRLGVGALRLGDARQFEDRRDVVVGQGVVGGASRSRLDVHGGP
jgi:hypothetical protein